MLTHKVADMPGCYKLSKVRMSIQGLTNLRMYESKIQRIRNDIRLLIQRILPNSKNHRYENRDKEQ